MATAALCFFGGALLYAILAKLLTHIHGERMFRRTLFFMIAATIALSNLMEQQLRDMRHKRTDLSREKLLEQETADQNFLENFQTAVIVNFFNTLPKYLHPLITFFDWETAKKELRKAIADSEK